MSRDAYVLLEDGTRFDGLACGADTRSTPTNLSDAHPPAIGPSATPAALRASYLSARQKEGGPTYHFERDATARATGHAALDALSDCRARPDGRHG